MYAIQQTYINYETGVQWVRMSKRRWKTYRGANKAARSIEFSWVCRPDGKAKIEESSAIIIDLESR